MAQQGPLGCRGQLTILPIFAFHPERIPFPPTQNQNPSGAHQVWQGGITGLVKAVLTLLWGTPERGDQDSSERDSSDEERLWVPTPSRSHRQTCPLETAPCPLETNPCPLETALRPPAANGTPEGR